MTTCMKLPGGFYNCKLVDATKIRILGGGKGEKAKIWSLGTDEGYLAFFIGLAEEGKSGMDRRLFKLHVCTC